MIVDAKGTARTARPALVQVQSSIGAPGDPHEQNGPSVSGEADCGWCTGPVEPSSGGAQLETTAKPRSCRHRDRGFIIDMQMSPLFCITHLMDKICMCTLRLLALVLHTVPEDPFVMSSNRSAHVICWAFVSIKALFVFFSCLSKQIQVSLKYAAIFLCGGCKHRAKYSWSTESFGREAKI